MSSSKAVIYHYFEKDATYKDNLVYFLSVAIESDIDYFFVISGECSIELPQRPNIQYIHTANWNNDFGGYIGFVKNFFPNAYEYFIFINASVRGPFLAHYFSSSWTDIFTFPLKGNTHLVGASINLLPVQSKHSRSFAQKYDYSPPFNHVQTSAYALSRQGILHLIEIGFYNVTKELSKDEVIDDYELRMSQEILRKGWQIDTFMPLYGEFVRAHSTYDYANFSAIKGDVFYKKAFFGRTLSPTESVFVKVNRNMVDPCELASCTFTSLYSHQSDFPFGASKELMDRSYQTAQKSKPWKLKIRHFFKPPLAQTGTQS